MNRIVNMATTACATAWASKLQKRVSVGVFAVMSVFCFMLASTSAHAACGNYGGIKINGAPKLPMMKNAVPGLYIPFHDGISPIVGLWHVIYTASDDSPFNDTFDSWHSDGTEFESAYLAPAGGNVCAGVWKPTGFRSVALHHVGWLFNPSHPTDSATNSFTLDEEVTVSHDGTTYSGTFTFKIWNLDGTPTPVEVTGTISATRIVVE
jgi:hypothetical protein